MIGGDVNNKLKGMIYFRGMRQSELARLCDMSELDLSKVITGRRKATAQERTDIASCLKIKEDTLFEDG